VSGSPLEYSFDNCEFDDTVVITKQNWQKEDESYLPLSRMDAWYVQLIRLLKICSTLCLQCL